jgi:spermidine synthase
MKPWELLGDSHTPDGTRLTLMKRDREHVIFADGNILMSSRMHGSEEALATLACAHLKKASSPRVLVGGLGLGYTLRATLDELPAHATVVIAELVPGVVEWNRGPLGPLANHPLDDPRVTVAVGDVAVTMRMDKEGFDAILLDVDNGPDAFTSTLNTGLYANHGVAQAYAALKPGGVLAVWSAWEDKKFEQRMRWAGFKLSMHRVRARLKQGGPRHTIFVGAKAPAAAR